MVNPSEKSIMEAVSELKTVMTECQTLLKLMLIELQANKKTDK